MNSLQIENLLQLMHVRQYAKIMEEFVIFKNDVLDYCMHLRLTRSKALELQKLFPSRKTEIEKDLKETSLKIAGELAEKSLIFKNEKTLSNLSETKLPI